MPFADIVFGPSLPGVSAVQVPENRSEALINVYRDIDGKSLRRRPGLSLFKDFAEGSRSILGLFEPVVDNSSQIVLALRNGAATGVLAKITSAGVATTITGTSLANDRQPTWADTPIPAVAVANGGRINLCDITAGTAAPITTGNAPDGVTHVGWAKSFLISNGLISGGLDGDTNFSDDVLNAYAASDSWELYNNEQIADACDGLLIDHDEIFAWGKRSAEVSYNDGVTPWAALDGGFYPYGWVNGDTVVKLGATIYGLGYFDGDPHIIRLNQRQPEIISTPYDAVIRDFDFTNCRAWPLAYKGQTFYVISFPANNYTLVYSPVFKEWYRWSIFNGIEHLQMDLNAVLYAQNWNKTLVGSRAFAKIFYFDDSKNDDGSAIKSELTSGLITRGTMNRKRAEEYRFLFLRGDVSDASEPAVTVEFNDDHEGWVTADTVSLGTSSDAFVWAEIKPGGVYHSRQIRLTHTGTLSSFILARATERFTVMTH